MPSLPTAGQKPWDLNAWLLVAHNSDGTPNNLLASQVLAVDTPTFDFTGIPATFTDLVISLYSRGYGTGGVSDFPDIRFNNDNVTVWYSETQSTQGTTTAAPSQSNTFKTLSVGRTPAENAPVGAFGGNEIVVYGYASTVGWKPVTWQSHGILALTAGSYNIGFGGGTWASTAAINRITLTSDVGTGFAAGSQCHIYGR